MLATAIIAFREFLEAFLIVGVFLGISRKLKLKKELEIGLAATIGIIFSLALTTGTYIFGDRARTILTEKNADFLESYLLIFSGLFIAYVVFSLHDVIRRGRGQTLIAAHQKLQQNTFDLTLFFTIIFLVIREGFEVALFTASASLFSVFMQNFLGLLIGFASASILGLATFFAYIKFPIGRVFKATEYTIILLGASLVQNGITKLFETHLNMHLSEILSLPLSFLPDKDSLIGHILQSLLGIDRNFSLMRLALMIIYIGFIYLLFIKRRKAQMVKLKPAPGGRPGTA